MSGLRKFILPIALVILAIGTEVVGIILCGKMLPDYKNEVFEEEKKNITQLIFVNDEDNSRFYPWLSYHEDEFVSAETYIGNHLFDENIINLIDYDYYEEIYGDKWAVLGFNQMILAVISTFDIKNYPAEEPDFSKSANFDSNASIVCIKDFEFENQDGKTKLFDLVMEWDSKDVLYFRIRDKSPANPTSQEISQKNKQLSEDVDEVFLYIKELFSEQKEYQEEMPEEVAQHMKYDAEADIEQEQNENIISKYINSIHMPEIYVENENYVFSILADDKIRFPIRVVIPSTLFNSQYTVFSNGDELMVVFSGNDNTSKYSNTIIYYSINENKITGFSMGSTF